VTIVNELGDCIAAIHSVQAEYVRRKGKPYTTQVFLIVDELAELLGAIQDEEAKKALLTALGSIARAGRSSGVRLTLITQKSLVDIVGSEIKGNLPHKLAGKVTTREESKIATGLDDIGCEFLPGAGSYYYVDNGVASRIQGFYLPDEQRMSVIAGIAAKNEGIKPYRIPMIDSIAIKTDYNFEEDETEPFDNEGFDSAPSLPVEPEPIRDPVEELVAKYGQEVVEAWITERDNNNGEISGAKISKISKTIRGAGIDGTNSAKIRRILCPEPA
jgi:DNA segregation ATPase FtsK/SpoIIIE-like protein